MSTQIQELVEAINNASHQEKHKLRCMFLIDAKKLNPNITVLECRKLLGFFSENEEEDTRLQASFRNDIFNPTRNFITKNIFGINSDECNKIWERSASDDVKEKRAAVLNNLPQSTRNRKDKPTQLEAALAQEIQNRGYSLT